jgi:hypothetical protein
VIRKEKLPLFPYLIKAPALSCGEVSVWGLFS